MQELFCIGTDLSQKVLNRLEEGFTEEARSIHLISAACRGTVSNLVHDFHPEVYPVILLTAHNDRDPEYSTLGEPREVNQGRPGA